jgi:hypothetical protein
MSARVILYWFSRIFEGMASFGLFQVCIWGKPITLTHFRECPNWQDGYESYKKTLSGSKHAKESTLIDLDLATPMSSTGSRANSQEGKSQPSKT